MGGKIKVILFLVLIAGVILYVISSGVISKGFGVLGSLTPSASSSNLRFGTSTFFNFPNLFGPSKAPTGPSYVSTGGGYGTGFGYNSGSNTNSGGNNTQISGSAPTTINPGDIPKGYTLAELSPYFRHVHFDGVFAGNFYNYGSIRLNAYVPNGTDAIDITGWQIRSLSGGEYIPQAINFYDPSGLTPASDILLKTGDNAYLYSTSAPFNLRINECVGYLSHEANFVPTLQNSCPYADRSQIQNFTGACQNYIQSIASCQAPNMASPQIPRTDYACRDYLENHFNYRSCVIDHGNDPNFLGDQVWVWMGGNIVDQYHDTVKLLDKNGLLVDIYSY